MKASAAFLAAFLAAGCDWQLPGRPSKGSEVVRPTHELDFAVLYGSNCSGCHGPNGRGGASVELGDPVYLAFADDAVLAGVTANGVPGTAMPAFAQSSGGMLTDAQVQALVHGMRARWGKANVLQAAQPPPYAATQDGDAVRGAAAYANFCARCHGAGGRGGKATAIVDGTYLALVSQQHLRTTILIGRPDLGAPDWRENIPGRPMTADEVSDVVAWLSGQRPAFPGQPYPSASAGAGERK